MTETLLMFALYFFLLKPSLSTTLSLSLHLQLTLTIDDGCGRWERGDLYIKTQSHKFQAGAEMVVEIGG